MNNGQGIFLFFLVLLILFFFLRSYFNNLVKFHKVSKGYFVVDIYGFSFSYGVGVDSNQNIFIPDFKYGYIYKFSNQFRFIGIYKLNNNGDFKKVSLIEKFAKTYLPFPFFLKNYIKKPHDIFFDNDGLMYITEMGLGNELGKGKVRVLKDFDMVFNISYFDHNEGTDGLIDPVMTYVLEDLVYVSESGADRIIKYKKNKVANRALDSKNLITYNYSNQEISFPSVKFNKPHAIKIGPDNNFYIADSSNHRICKFKKDGKFLGWIGKRSDGEIISDWSLKGSSIAGNELGAFNTPIDFVFKDDFFIVTDCFNHRIVKVLLSGKSIKSIGGDLNVSKKKNSDFWDIETLSKPSKGALGFNKPFGIKTANDMIYIADKQNCRIKIINLKVFELQK